MNKLIILSALFMMSCASGYRKHELYSVKYTVREYYFPSPVAIKSVKPVVKKAKKHVKIDCKRVLKEINKCSI